MFFGSFLVYERLYATQDLVWNLFHTMKKIIKTYMNSVSCSIHNFSALRHRETWWHFIYLYDYTINQLWPPLIFLLHLYVFQWTQIDPILFVLYKIERKKSERTDSLLLISIFYNACFFFKKLCMFHNYLKKSCHFQRGLFWLAFFL